MLALDRGGGDVVTEAQFEAAVKLCDELTAELARLFVASGDAVTYDGRLGANQVRRAVELHGQTTAAVHLARSAAYFDQHEEGGVKE